MKVIFMGTPDFAVPSLMHLVKNSAHHVKGVVTSADKPRGRGRRVSPSSVKSCALSLDLPVLQPQKLSEPDFLQEIRSLSPDIFVVVAFRILPEDLFSIPRHGTINLHASLLPKYRGAAPIEWAIINGEKKTGLTIFQIDEGIDTGSILLQKEMEIQPEETAGELSYRMADSGAKLVIESLDMMEAGTITPQKQYSKESSHAPKLTPELLTIDWNRPAKDIVNLVRGLSPEPAAHTFHNNMRLKIFRARALNKTDEDAPAGRILKASPKTGIVVKSSPGAVELISVQREGKRRMPAGELLRGVQMKEGETLG